MDLSNFKTAEGHLQKVQRGVRESRPATSLTVVNIDGELTDWLCKAWSKLQASEKVRIQPLDKFKTNQRVRVKYLKAYVVK